MYRVRNASYWHTVNFYFNLKKSAPQKIISEITDTYAPYLIEDEEEFVDSTTTDWYKEMKKNMKSKDYLKTYRSMTGYSQAKLGALVDLPASRISDYETALRVISKNIAKKLAEMFNTSPVVFI